MHSYDRPGCPRMKGENRDVRSQKKKGEYSASSVPRGIMSQRKHTGCASQKKSKHCDLVAWRSPWVPPFLWRGSQFVPTVGVAIAPRGSSDQLLLKGCPEPKNCTRELRAVGFKKTMKGVNKKKAFKILSTNVENPFKFFKNDNPELRHRDHKRTSSFPFSA